MSKKMGNISIGLRLSLWCAFISGAFTAGAWVAAAPHSEGQEARFVSAALAGLGVAVLSFTLVYLIGRRIDRDLDRLRAYLDAALEGSSPSGLHVSAHAQRLAHAIVHSVAKLQDAVERTRGSMRQAELKQRIAEAQHRHMEGVLDALRDGVIVTNAFDEVTFANRAAGEVLGFDPEESRMQKLAEVVRDERICALAREARESPVPNRRAQIDHTIETEAGAPPSVFEITVTRTHEIEGAGAAVVTILRDVTYEREVSRMKSDFVSKASHELRTPLSSIKAYVEMLLDGEAKDEESRREFYSVIKNESDRLSRLIDNMLNISRIEAGIIRVQPREINFVEAAQRVVDLLQPQAKAKDISLSVQSGPLVYTAMADEDMMQQVLLNLVSNAIKYTPEGGRVTVSVENDDAQGAVMVTVADTGLGIPPDDVEKIFDKFYRVDNYKRVAPGTGLGLNLVKHIVETVHHGQVTVSSELGLGSRFTFTVPYEMDAVHTRSAA